MSKKLTINVGDAVNDIRSGMTDSEMMERYGLSAKGLHRLFKKLLEMKAITQYELDRRSESDHDTVMIRQIDSPKMIDDVRSGMKDSELMNKYALSPDGLQRAFQKMIDEKVMTSDDHHGTFSVQYDTFFVEKKREVPRYDLVSEVVIYELKRPDIKGVLINISEKGIEMKGIKVRMGETKTFIIPSAEFIQVDPIRFDAVCKWGAKDPVTGDWLSGFEIKNISTKCWDDLLRLVQTLSSLG